MAQQTRVEAFAQQAGALQQSILQARARLTEVEVTGTDGPAGVRLSAAGELLDIQIDPSGTGDVPALQRHILAAYAQARAEARALTQEIAGTLNELMSRVAERL